MILFKRFLLFLLLLSGAFILTTSNIIADDPPPCVPDCPLVTFTIPQTTETFEVSACTEESGPSCSITVTYTWRTGCDDWQDVQITKLSNGQYCNNCGLEEYFRQALLAIIKKNTMDFDPKVDSVGCDSTWRFIIYSCWNMIYVPVGDDDTARVWLACVNSTCCEQELAVCRNPNGSINVTSLGDPTGQDDCPVEDCGMYSVCDWFDFDDFYFIKAPCLEIYDDQQPSIISQVGDPIKIIIHKETIELNEFHGKKGNMTFNLFDIYGNAVIQTSAQIGSVNYRMIISTSDLISGVYLYQIVFDDKVLQTGKLPIVR